MSSLPDPTMSSLDTFSIVIRSASDLPSASASSTTLAGVAPVARPAPLSASRWILPLEKRKAACRVWK